MTEKRKTVISTPTSYHTAEMSEIVLSETPKTKLVFEPLHVDNPNDRKKQLRGKLVFQKPKIKNGEQKLTRRDIHAGEYFSLDLDTTEVYNLAEGLLTYCDITRDTGSPLVPTEYVSASPDAIQIAQMIEERPEILQCLSMQSMEMLNAKIRVQELINIQQFIQQNMNNDNEQFWQDLFREHSWIISQIFSLPYMLLQNQPYVGGKGIENLHGRFPDYLFQNGITENVSIVELKTPCTELLYDSSYRDGVYAPHKSLTGAVTQILEQRDTLYKTYFTTMGMSKIHFEANNIECVLIVGNTGKLLDVDKKKSFELYRNELRNVKVIGFDELLKKIEIMIALLTDKQPNTPSEVFPVDLEDELPF